MNRLIVIISLLLFSLGSKSQSTGNVKLDPLAVSYFSQTQIDTMSQEFIKVQNYLIRYSWHIYSRWDKHRDTIVKFNRDTIDIRPFLESRLDKKNLLIYDVYPGLVVQLDSKESVLFRIKEIYSNK
jgi:hypothetical protein